MCLSRCAAHLLKKIWFYLKPEYLLIFQKNRFFQISLVRQFSNDDEEFYQIHVDILYEPTAENKIFSETTWDEDLDENIFDYIRKSASFAYARNHEYIEVKIYMDET